MFTAYALDVFMLFFFFLFAQSFSFFVSHGGILPAWLWWTLSLGMGLVEVVPWGR